MGVPAAVAAGEDVSDEEKKPKKVEEKKKENVTIKLTGYATPKKINVVKEVRAVTALGLKEAKDLVEGVPKVIKKGVPIAEAEAIKEKLEKAGGEVILE